MNTPANKPDETPKSGGCQCGAVRYQISGEPRALYVCHCLECQKQSASAFGMSLLVRRVDFRLTLGAVKLWSRLAASGRTVRCLFCAQCGSRLWHEYDPESEVIRIKAGTVDRPTDMGPAIHIWTSSKLPGVVIPDGAAQFPNAPA